MLDYTINHYEVKVWYLNNANDGKPVVYEFQQEERAVEFIRLNRFHWEDYILYKIEHANIDF